MKINELNRACEECQSAETSEVTNPEEHLRTGWLCLDCNHFTKALGRERLWRGEQIEAFRAQEREK